MPDISQSITLNELSIENKYMKREIETLKSTIENIHQAHHEIKNSMIKLELTIKFLIVINLIAIPLGPVVSQAAMRFF